MTEVIPESICNTFSWSRSGIESTQNGFQLIKFCDKTRELVGYKDVMADMTNILVIRNTNRLTFKDNIEYVWACFMQVSKVTKGSMTIFFTNPNLVLI